VAAEAVHDAGDFTADFAGADDANSLAMNIEAKQAIQGEVAFADAGVGAVDFAIEG
jgi:hypothetical protein